jgi:hypothetical protein
MSSYQYSDMDLDEMEAIREHFSKLDSQSQIYFADISCRLFWANGYIKGMQEGIRLKEGKDVSE